MDADKIFKAVDVYDKMPDGWAELKGASCAPRGYKFIWNRKSIFGGEYCHGLLKINYQNDGCGNCPQKETDNLGGLTKTPKKDNPK